MARKEPCIVRGTPQTGLWCKTCQLPSTIAIRFYELRKNGVKEVGHAVFCPDCEERKRSERNG